MTSGLDFTNPLVQAAAGLVCILLIILWIVLRSSQKTTRLIEHVSFQTGSLGQPVQELNAGQERLAGGLHHVSEAQAQSQAGMMQLMEQRLAQVQNTMNENLQGAARRTSHSLGELQQKANRN